MGGRRRLDQKWACSRIQPGSTEIEIVKGTGTEKDESKVTILVMLTERMMPCPSWIATSREFVVWIVR